MRHLAISLILILSTVRMFADDPPAEVPRGEIAGVVTNEEGQPIENALVDAWSWFPGNETRTDKDGRFELKGIMPGLSAPMMSSCMNVGASDFGAPAMPWYCTMPSGTPTSVAAIMPQRNAPGIRRASTVHPGSTSWQRRMVG